MHGSSEFGSKSYHLISYLSYWHMWLKLSPPLRWRTGSVKYIRLGWLYSHIVLIKPTSRAAHITIKASAPCQSHTAAAFLDRCNNIQCLPLLMYMYGVLPLPNADIPSMTLLDVTVNKPYRWSTCLISFLEDVHWPRLHWASWSASL